MTMRITIEIVPFGDESAKYPLSTINVSDIGGSSGYYDYTITKTSHNVDGTTESAYYGTVTHFRNAGHLELANIVLNRMQDQNI
jgi:hypothetical protein